MNNVFIVLCPPQKACIIKNLYPLYNYDLSEFEDVPYNEYGIPGSSKHKSWEEKNNKLDIWWKDKEQRFPYIIYRDKEPIGFCLVACPTKPDEDIDNYLVEFFIAKKHRNQGIGREIAKEIIKKFNGRWTLRVLPRNRNAYVFWQKTIKEIGNAIEYREYTDDDKMNCIDFKFKEKNIKE